MRLAFSIATLFFAASICIPEHLERLITVHIEKRDEVHRFTRFTVVDAAESYIKLLATDEEIEEIERMGYTVTILFDDYRDVSASILAKGEYHTYDSAVAEITQTALEHSDIVHVDTIGYSVAGRALLAIRISDNPSAHEGEPGIRLTGAHHGNEQISLEICLFMMNYLTDNYSTDSYVQGLVDTREIWIIPMVNPDGVVLNQRRNANGVDLNRNYGYMWEGTGGDSAPFSEPETKAIRNHAQDNRFVLGFDYHSTAQYVNYLWDYTPILAQDNDLIVDLAHEYGDSTGYTPINGWSWYQVHGSCQDASYGLEGIIDFTIETPFPADPDPVSQDNRGAILRMIQRAGEGIHGVVTDAVTGESLAAVVEVIEVGWPVHTHSRSGDYHRLLLPGTYTLKVWANAYEEKIVNDVVVPAGGSTKVDVELQPGASSYGYRLVLANIADPDNSYNNQTLTKSALGSPDGEFLSMGVGGELTMDMGEETPIVNRTGVDFTIYEGDDGDQMEEYSVYLSNSWNGPWVLLGSGAGTTGFDISGQGFAEVRYLRIADDGDGDPNGSYPGFDLDAVESAPMSAACGDANGDTEIDFADALYIKNYYYQTPPGSPPPIGQGDVNLDGYVTFGDALYIKDYYYQTPPGSPPPCEPPPVGLRQETEHE